ncbi:dihydrofolate reductase family protein [Streptomyces sp. NPDC049881]|uniref:dihydrofolate reductase family protein n=1 Tax=unclassified Streptomyces TaxID=2593676 RepID=UPI0034311E6B
MRKLVHLVAATLDGFIAAPDASDPSAPGGLLVPTPEYVEHLVATYPETLPGPARAALGVEAEGTHFDTVVEGRGSYDIGLAAGFTDAYPHLRHVVFSRTLGESPDPGVRVVAGDPVATVRELKREEGDKDIWLVGGATLAGVLYDEIDRLVLKLNPVTAGTGIPLFGAGAAFRPAAWRLTDHTVLAGGTAFLTYDRVPGGEPSA